MACKIPAGKLLQAHLLAFGDCGQPTVVSNNPEKIIPTKAPLFTDVNIPEKVASVGTAGEQAGTPHILSAKTNGAGLATINFGQPTNDVAAVVLEFDYPENTVSGLDIGDMAVTWKAQDGTAKTANFKAILEKGLTASVLPFSNQDAFVDYSPIPSGDVSDGAGGTVAQAVSVTGQFSQEGVIVLAHLVNTDHPLFPNLQKSAKAAVLLREIKATKELQQSNIDCDGWAKETLEVYKNKSKGLFLNS